MRAGSRKLKVVAVSIHGAGVCDRPAAPGAHMSADRRELELAAVSFRGAGVCYLFAACNLPAASGNGRQLSDGSRKEEVVSASNCGAGVCDVLAVLGACVSLAAAAENQIPQPASIQQCSPICGAGPCNCASVPGPYMVKWAKAVNWQQLLNLHEVTAAQIAAAAAGLWHTQGQKQDARHTLQLGFADSQHQWELHPAA